MTTKLGLNFTKHRLDESYLRYWMQLKCRPQAINILTECLRPLNHINLQVRTQFSYPRIC